LNFLIISSFSCNSLLLLVCKLIFKIFQFLFIILPCVFQKTICFFMQAPLFISEFYFQLFNLPNNQKYLSKSNFDISQYSNLIFMFISEFIQLLLLLLVQFLLTQPHLFSKFHVHIINLLFILSFHIFQFLFVLSFHFLSHFIYPLLPK